MLCISRHPKLLPVAYLCHTETHNYRLRYDILQPKKIQTVMMVPHQSKNNALVPATGPGTTVYSGYCVPPEYRSYSSPPPPLLSEPEPMISSDDRREVPSPQPESGIMIPTSNNSSTTNYFVQEEFLRALPFLGDTDHTKCFNSSSTNNNDRQLVPYRPFSPQDATQLEGYGVHFFLYFEELSNEINRLKGKKDLQKEIHNGILKNHQNALKESKESYEDLKDECRTIKQNLQNKELEAESVINERDELRKAVTNQAAKQSKHDELVSKIFAEKQVALQHSNEWKNLSIKLRHEADGESLKKKGVTAELKKMTENRNKTQQHNKTLAGSLNNVMTLLKQTQGTQKICAVLKEKLLRQYDNLGRAFENETKEKEKAQKSVEEYALNHDTLLRKHNDQGNAYDNLSLAFKNEMKEKEKAQKSVEEYTRKYDDLLRKHNDQGNDLLAAKEEYQKYLSIVHKMSLADYVKLGGVVTKMPVSDGVGTFGIGMESFLEQEYNSSLDPNNITQNDCKAVQSNCTGAGYACQHINSKVGHDVRCPRSKYYDPNDVTTLRAQNWREHEANKKRKRDERDKQGNSDGSKVPTLSSTPTNTNNRWSLPIHNDHAAGKIFNYQKQRSEGK